jgi:hypothetical protein
MGALEVRSRGEFERENKTFDSYQLTTRLPTEIVFGVHSRRSSHADTPSDLTRTCSYSRSTN